MKTKGILLAGGTGSRLYPITKAVNKQLLPVYNKPMIYYSLSLLLLSEINDILIICNKQDKEKYYSLFEDGSNLGINIEYQIQEKPRGIAEAFIIGEEFIGKDNCELVLGDNILFGSGLTQYLKEAKLEVEKNGGAIIFGKEVSDPTKYGVIEFDNNGNIKNIIEKPKDPPSNYAVPGIYFYDNSVIEYAKKLKPSSRGELEITDINNKYLKENKLNVKTLPRGTIWFDAGTPESLLEASNFIEAYEKRTGKLIGCIEEIAYRNKWINKNKLFEIGKKMEKTQYGKYLLKLSGEKE